MDFKLLFERSPDVLLVLLPDSPRFTMVAGTDARFQATHTTRDTLDKGLFEVFPDNPDDPEATGTSNLRASLERVLVTRQPDTMAVQKYDIRGPDGGFQRKFWSPKNIPVLGDDGAVVYILHCVEDVTELVEASELGQVLRDRTRQMEREVISRSRELADANRNLRDANLKLGELDTAKTAFFSNVSHEFRTPLTLILGPLEGALGRKPAGLSGEELSGVHRNALRLLRLVNNLLDFSRIEAGRLEAHFEAVDLATLTAGLVGSFQSLFDDAGLGLVVDFPPLPEAVYVDRAQWEKIVLNLVSNAFKFTLQGEVAVALAWCGDHVELRVRDTGSGIPEPELPRIFERFHRVQGARGRSFEGSGIGLSLVDAFVRQHGGSIRATSTPGQGSLFTVSLPTGSAHLPGERVEHDGQRALSDIATRAQLLEAKRWLATPDAPRALPDAAARGRILVVDDNADMRQYVAALLGSHWSVEAVADGESALVAARRSPPDLVLSDMMMPGMDGAELLAALRADPRTHTIPVILISARAGEEARLEGLETGADDYLVKPFSARELLTRVNTHLQMAAARRAAAAELERKNEDLRHSIEALATAQAQLVQAAKMASLGQLVAGIAHEINNPLAFVLNHLNTIARSLNEVESRLGPELLAGPATPWHRALERLRETHGGLQRIQELVLKLRTFSRLDEGERKHVSVQESVASVLTILGHRLEQRIEVRTRFEAPDGIDCYAGLLNQALMNLLTNAIDAIDAIGESGTIEIWTRVDGDWFALGIKDSGTGVPDSIRERVFEPFFTTKPPGQGTGLGLSIVYSIAEKHGGRVELARSEGGGTNAVIYLPRASTLAS